MVASEKNRGHRRHSSSSVGDPERPPLVHRGVRDHVDLRGGWGAIYCDRKQWRLSGYVQFIDRGESAMDTISRDTADQLTRALGEAVVRIWSDLPQDVQHHLFEEAITSKGETIRPQLAVFLHDKHRRTSDPLGKPRETIEPDSLGG
jgi:hypothetical protein